LGYGRIYEEVRDPHVRSPGSTVRVHTHSPAGIDSSALPGTAADDKKRRARSRYREMPLSAYMKKNMEARSLQTYRIIAVCSIRNL